LKIMNDYTDEKLMDMVEAEVEGLMNVGKHLNIINLIDHGLGTYEKTNGKRKNVYYIVFERALCPDLFDFVE